MSFTFNRTKLKKFVAIMFLQVAAQILYLFLKLYVITSSIMALSIMTLNITKPNATYTLALCAIYCLLSAIKLSVLIVVSQLGSFCSVSFLLNVVRPSVVRMSVVAP